MTTQPDTLAQLRADGFEGLSEDDRDDLLDALLDIAEAAQAVDKARDAHVSETTFVLLLDNLAAALAALDAADSGAEA